jgi:phenylacetate-CoA ligase
LPTVRVLGRSAFGYPVAGHAVTQNQLEELVFGLPAQYGVLFWRARAEPAILRVEIEVAPQWQDEACMALINAIGRELPVPCSVTGVAPGSLVPLSVLTANHDVVKPRSLFGAEEDWSKALLYH